MSIQSLQDYFKFNHFIIAKFAVIKVSVQLYAVRAATLNCRCQLH